jgi:GPH family glycoside/pentoside/hexuronide:cation symporter
VYLHRPRLAHLTTEQLPFSKQITYACGMMGWSILTNIIGVLLIYFYLPPFNSGLVTLLAQVSILGVLNLPSVITIAGRLADAFYDPFIGQASDRSKNRQGRRIPFMKWSILPAVVFCILVFRPPTDGVSTYNAIWLTFTLILFFISATTYIIPYNALMPEMAHTTADKVRFSTFQQVGFVLGMIIASSTANIANGVQYLAPSFTRMEAFQVAIWSLSALGGLFMLIPVLTIDEKRYCKADPSSLPLLPAIRQTLKNKNFLYYVAADFSYFMALYIILSGLQYFVTVLCGLPESIGVILVGTMVGLSLLFYPLINFLAKRIGKKPVVIAAFLLLAVAFTSIYFLGKFPIPPKAQMFLLVALAAFPLAALGILPPAILAEIAHEDAELTGENKEGLFFAVKYFSVKLGQTFGIGLFATLTLYGKDPGNDYGLRLNGLFGAALCLLAILVFSRFKEKRTESNS